MFNHTPVVNALFYSFIPAGREFYFISTFKVKHGKPV